MRRFPLITLFILLCIVSCSLPSSESPEDLAALKELHRLRVKALESGDADLFSRILSDDYRDRGGGKREKLESIREMTRGGRLSAIRFGPPEIVIRGDGAEISSSYRMSIRVEGRVIEVDGEERLLLRKQRDGWRIVGGL